VGGSKVERRVALALVLVAVIAAGCGVGSDPSSKPTFIAAGQIPRSDVPTKGESAADAAGSSADTVPLAKQDPTTALFTAIGTFQSCLSGLGVTFIGAPSQGNPNSNTNNPQYIKNLTTCAAKSDIVQALKTEQTAQDNLTTSQIAAENKDYIKWRDCMIGRGWGIPVPKPNSKGELFSFGGSGGGASGFTPPPGQSLLSSSDMQDCAALAEQGRS
jgi:hypothetical protein